MKIVLPFNLLPHLDDTGIAACYGLKNSEGHTVVDLGAREAHDLLKLLRALEEELRSRHKLMQRTASRAPIAVHKRPATETRLVAIQRAADAISSKLDAATPSRGAKEHSREH